MTGPDGLVDNLFLLNYVPRADETPNLQTERLIELDDSRSIRIQNIDADDYRWVFLGIPFNVAY